MERIRNWQVSAWFKGFALPLLQQIKHLLAILAMNVVRLWSSVIADR
ncbi:hypothetical protein ART_0317 [Arthrobacter sp. PAMC 25486]|nr:hypothetical protein ART_0317 [Arthrobacter sp. PAMC 25486]